MAAAAPAPSVERRRRRRYDDVRARIFDTAIDLFAQHGIVNTRVESITAAADVAKGTFFNYFPTKEAIVVELAKRLITDLWIVAQRARTADSIRPILAALPDAFLGVMRGSPVLCRSVFGALLLYDSLAAHLEEIENSTRLHLAYIIERGQEVGEIRTDRSAEDLARALQHVLWASMLSWRDGADVRGAMTAALEIFWRGIAVDDSGEPDWCV